MPPPRGFALTPEMAGRVSAAVEWVEAQPGERPPEDGPPRARAANWQFVKVTGGPQGEFWPAVVTVYDANARQWAELAPCWLLEANGLNFTPGWRHEARQSGNLTVGDDERALFIATADAASAFGSGSARPAFAPRAAPPICCGGPRAPASPREAVGPAATARAVE